MRVNIRDKNFSTTDKSSCHLAVNKHIEWYTGNEVVSSSCFITDLCLSDVHKAAGVKRKIAWILEPRSIHPAVYHWIEQHNNLFDFVLTFDKQLISKGQNYLYYPHGRCWIHNTDGIESKNKVCSIFASKKGATVGHRLRHEVIDKLKSLHLGVDYFGGYVNNHIDKKEQGLNSFMYSITIENSIIPGYWTEKLVDCFATKTVPIYYGDRESVCKFFDPEGIIFFETVDELVNILNNISIDDYTQRLRGIINNYRAVPKFRIPEDWIFENYPFLFDL